MRYGNSIKYLLLQLKRAAYRFPTIFAGTLLLAVTLALVLITVVNDSNSDEKKTMVNVGVTGDLSSEYAEMALMALKSLDDSRFAISLTAMDEEQAKEKLINGEIGAYFVVPEGIVESIMYGRSFSIKYYTCKSQAGLGTMLVNEFSNVLYKYLTNSQNGIYGMQELCQRYGDEDLLWTGTEQLNIEYITFVLDRQAVYDVHVLGIAKELSLPGYYICSLIVVFFMLFGLNGCVLYINKDTALKKLLSAKGCTAFLQVMAEFLTYSLLLVITSITILSAAGIVCDAAYIRTVEWDFIDFITLWNYCIKLIPVMLMFTAMALLGHELAGNLVSGLLLQFILAIGMGYLSGCFYPSSFFPEIIQLLGRFLPSGVAMEYASKGMLNKSMVGEFVNVAVYVVFFLTVTCLLRKRKLSKDGGC